MKENYYVLILRILLRSNFDDVLLRSFPAKRPMTFKNICIKEHVDDSFPQKLLHIALLELVIMGQLFLKTHMILLESS